MSTQRLSDSDLRDFYRQDYVDSYKSKDTGSHPSRITRLIPLCRLKPTDVVVDLACGNGMLLKELHDQVAGYHGVDFSSEFIEAARSRARQLNAGNAVFHEADIVEFCGDHPDEFDVAFTLDFSEHVYDEDFVRIATSIRSSLKPDGRLFVHTPNATYFLEILKARGILRQFPSHIAVRNARENVALLQAAGFRDIKVSYLSHYLPPLSWLHPLRHLPLAGRFFQARLFIECTA